MKVLKRFFQFVLVVYVIALAGLYFTQERFLFLPDVLSPQHQFYSGEETFIPMADGTRLHALHWTPNKPRGVILFWHGNKGSNQRCIAQARGFLDRGYALVMPDYRGYGKSEGQPQNEEQIFTDAQTVYNYLKQSYAESDIIVLGYSLGSAPSSYLAAHNQPKELILVAPFKSMLAMKQRFMPIIPSFLVKYPFRNDEHVAASTCPIRIFHGTNDQLIPVEDGRHLASIDPSRIQFTPLQGVSHRGAIFRTADVIRF